MPRLIIIFVQAVVPSQNAYIILGPGSIGGIGPCAVVLEEPLERVLLEIIASSVRSFLETVWPDWQMEKSARYGGQVPSIMSYSTCGRSSTFVQMVLDACAISAEVQHGWFDGEGYAKPSGSEGRHSWVGSGPWIIDVTADQFGMDKVIVTNAADSRYYIDVDVALPENKLRRIQAAEEIWDRWLCSQFSQNLSQALMARHLATSARID